MEKKNEMLKLPKVPLERIVNAVYKLSVPMGLGQLHYKPGELSVNEQQMVVLSNTNLSQGVDWDGMRLVMYLDYVKGRCCKFRLYEADGEYYIYNKWPDHTSAQITALLEDLNAP